MSKVLDFCKDETPNFKIKVEDTEEFKKASRELSDFVFSLPLSHADNDKLIKLMVIQVSLAEKQAFEQGAQWGAMLNELDTKCSE